VFDYILGPLSEPVANFVGVVSEVGECHDCNFLLKLRHHSPCKPLKTARKTVLRGRFSISGGAAKGIWWRRFLLCVHC
jgi:hypothetical protein